MESFLYQATIYLATAIALVPLSRRFGLGSVLGYLFAGILIGPVFGLVGQEARDIQHFAEFGVVMMLFVIGLELEPRALWDMRARLFGLGGLQILLTAFVIAALAILARMPPMMAVAVGMALSLSSTAIVLQTIDEKGLLPSPGGRAAFSVLLAQDIAVIPMLAVMPLFASGAVHNFTAPDAGHGTGHGEAGPAATQAAISFIQSLPGWGATLVTLGAIAAVILAGRYLMGPLFRYVGAARLPELTTATALLIVIAIALMMTLVGLSPALGSFLAGVVLANSEFRHQLEADIEPFKGLLLGLFFITVGAGIDLGVLVANPGVVIAATIALMAAKFAILLPLGRIFGLRGRDQWLFALGLAQTGEFAFVLLSFMVQTNVLPTDSARILLLVVGLSMLLTPALFAIHDRIAARHGGIDPREPDADIAPTGTVLIAGAGRFGQVVNRLLTSAGFETTLLDSNYDTIRAQRALGMKSFFGDPTRLDLLRAAGLREARVLVVAVGPTEDALKIVRLARRERPDLHIVARARDRSAVYELYHAGANDIVREVFDSSVRAGRYTLEALGLGEFDAARAAEEFTRHDRRLLKELALLWRPGVPMEQNPEYMRRIRELNADLRTLLFSREAPPTDRESEARVVEELDADDTDAADDAPARRGDAA
ncbi:MAG: potassium transporter [Alphaproteobacteria bacterium]|nr:MAG: potassium transporter [Alphaproteobacteria bacterium]